jgi:hypothetical protein
MFFRTQALALILVACSHEAQKAAPPRITEAPAPAPVKAAARPTLDVFLDSFQVQKDDHAKAIETRQFCKMKNADFMQCALFDGEAPDANLVGIEYIISERLYQKLPADEQELWHPRNYEITSGLLVMPGVPAAAEKAALAKMLNTYAKTWHVWDSERSQLPVGEPELMWSFNHDGEAPSQLIRERDARLDVNTQKKREQRKDLLPDVRPQQGEDQLQSRR